MSTSVAPRANAKDTRQQRSSNANANLTTFSELVRGKGPMDFKHALDMVNRVSVHRASVEAVEAIRPSLSLPSVPQVISLRFTLM
jgi:hypothetical protein